MNITTYINKYRGDLNNLRPELVPVVECKDGFSMSVQNSHYHYSGPYTVEIGFPSSVEPLIESYAENKDELTGTVYGWVPIDVVDEVCEKHGGITGPKVP